MRKALLLIIAAMTVLGATAGCVKKPDLRPDAERALDQFWDDLKHEGAIKSLDGKVVSSSPGTTQTILLEFGRNGVLHVSIRAPDGTLSQIYCDDRFTTVVTDKETAMLRAGCWGRDGFLVTNATYASQLALRDATAQSAVRQGDVINATFSAASTSNPVTYEALIRDGRITRLTLGGNAPGLSGANIVFQVNYGERENIFRPAEGRRAPGGVGSNHEFQPGFYQWVALDSGSASIPLDELEVRVLPAGAATNATPLATFELDASVDQVAGGFTFRFTADSDDVLEGGEGFNLTNPDWTQEDQFQVIVWDTWADGPTTGEGIPGVPAIGLILALAVLAWRRR